MTHDQNQAIDTDQADRAVWERPELKRIVAADAEAGGAGTTDLGVLS